MTEEVYCECCGDHLATVMWQKMRVCADCKRTFDVEADRVLGAAVRAVIRHKIIWKDGEFHSYLDWEQTSDRIAMTACVTMNVVATWATLCRVIRIGFGLVTVWLATPKLGSRTETYATGS